MKVARCGGDADALGPYRPRTHVPVAAHGAAFTGENTGRSRRRAGALACVISSGRLDAATPAGSCDNCHRREAVVLPCSIGCRRPHPPARAAQRLSPVKVGRARRKHAALGLGCDRERERPWSEDAAFTVKALVCGRPWPGVAGDARLEPAGPVASSPGAMAAPVSIPPLSPVKVPWAPTVAAGCGRRLLRGGIGA